MNTKPIIIVQGAQWGSEGKGMVAGALCERRKVDYAVRTGAVNAGHTVYHKGKPYKMQQLPVGWVAGDGCTLVIGPGAYIHPEIFFREVLMVRDLGYKGTILVDERAGLHLPEHMDRAGASGRHYLIGATGKGCSEAIRDRIALRGKGGKLFKDWYIENVIMPVTGASTELWEFCDTSAILNNEYDNGQQILLEGTQGNMLDLYLGPYPYTTHKQTLASQWVTEAGLSPGLDYEIVSVVRTHPIRVAGNSGPMPGEIDWPTLAIEINNKRHVAGLPVLVSPMTINSFMLAKKNFQRDRYPSEEVWKSESDRDAWNLLSQPEREELSKLFEFTTVTKKLRRIARMDIPSLQRSLMVDRPAWIALTFLNYEFPELWYEPEFNTWCNLNFSDKQLAYMENLEGQLGYKIGAVTCGPESHHYCGNL
jgi:adenylosuccinate synthase